jgi:hypothetical protein
MENNALLYGAIGAAVALSIRAARWYLSRRKRWEDEDVTADESAGRRTETLDDDTHRAPRARVVADLHA